MKERLEILQNILPTPLLAPSVSSLASTLGYRGRATIYRIINGLASDNAIDTFCTKLKDILFLDEYTLQDINTAIVNTGRLNKLMKAETRDFTTYTGFDVLKAFILHDYSIFTDDFRSRELPGLQRLERTDPDAFFSMLAYFYFKSLRTDFYSLAKTHKERCSAIIEPLGQRLIELYPSNGLAAQSVSIYSDSAILNSEAPILWNLITTLATILQYFGTPDIGPVVVKHMYLLSTLADRSYWKAYGSTLLLRAVKHTIPGSGYYDVFLVSPDAAKAESIGVMTFLSEEILSYRDKRSCNSQLGAFTLDDESLDLLWENETDRPLGVTNHWTRLPIERSRPLREFDRQLTNDRLNASAILADGFQLIPGHAVTNVNMSRRGVSLSLENGATYEISYTEAPFLEYIQPTNDVIISERMSDGEIFVSWPQLMHCIPLRLFTPNLTI